MENDKVKADFPRLLKEWRKENGLSQRELSKKIGVDPSTISCYEIGKACPSLEVAVKLTELGFDISQIPRGVHRTRCPEINAPLTLEEQRFAEDNHNLVYSFLACKRLPRNSWYDIVIFGYLTAIKKWFARPELHRYKFSGIAYSSMMTCFCNELAKINNRPDFVSLDDIIPGTEGLTYGDMLCDPRDCAFAF